MVVQETKRFEEKEATPEGITRVVGERARARDIAVGDVALSGSLIQSFAGIGAVVLTIIGLVGTLASWMLPIATIVAGVGLMFEGGAVAARYSRLIGKASAGTKEYVVGGITAEFLAGFIGVTLGILALLTLVPLILVAASAIVYGTSLVLDSGVTGRLHSLIADQHTDYEFAHQVAREAARTASGVHILLGLGVVTLGILSLVGISPLILGLVSILAIGFSVFLSGAAISSSIVSLFHR